MTTFTAKIAAIFVYVIIKITSEAPILYHVKF